MRYLARFALFGVAVSLGCGPAQPHATSSSTTPSVRVAGPVDTSSTLHVAFDDLSAAPKPTIPISLTASDGSGLALVGMEARAVIDDPLAFTELHLTFENPENRVREGTFSIVLPQGASISRFAMRVNNDLQEGEVVERQQARQAYEDFLHRRQDPALLEQNAGNEFSARVFPIPPKGKKEIIVSYSQEITAATPYLLPLKGLPEIGTLEVEAFVAGRAAPVQKLSQKKVIPAEDFRLEKSLFARRGGMRNGNLVALRVKPIVASRPDPLTDTLILVDTSASRALGLADASRVTGSICAAIAKASNGQGRVVVAAYDQAVDPIYEGPAGGFGEEAIGKIRQRLALGASNLEAALTWAGDQAKARGLPRVVLVSDGIPTAGATGGDRLRAKVLGMREKGVERVDAIGVGGIRDDDLLRSLANAGLVKGGTVIDAGMKEEELIRRLSEATARNIEVKVEGASFVFPSRLDGLQAGDEALVFANLPAEKAVHVSVGGGAWESPDVAKVERPLLERAWVGAKIKSLLEKERTDGPSEALSKEIVGLSTQFRVLSPKSALLVLESEWDYQRFGIDRKALADVLVTDGGQVSLLRRAVPAPPKAPPPPVVAAKPKGGPRLASGGIQIEAGDGMAGRLAGGAARPAGAAPTPTSAPLRNDPMSARGSMWGESAGDSFGAGGLGLTGVGEGGGGRGEGIGLGSVGTIGHGAGTGQGQGFGSSSGGHMGASGVTRPPPPGREASVRPPPEPAAPPLVGRPRLIDPDQGASVEREDDVPREPVAKADPYTGQFKTVMDLLAEKRLNEAVKTAFEWRKKDPGDVLALVALGEGFEAAGEQAQAARCYGSLIDLFPSRADVRRFAGERLERLGLASALDLAADTYEKAEEQRPDHPASHRLYAFTLLRKGQHQKAYEALRRGLLRGYPTGRFSGVHRILAEDLGLIAAAWIKAEPKREEEILRKVRDDGGLIEDQPSLRFVLNWETDANDVDFHIYDGKGGHAYYAKRKLGSGGVLYSDVTNGYGPECFTIRAPAGERSGPYKLQAHYYSRGPMGYGMGKLEVIEHDGQGGLTFEERPFVVMQDQAFVNLGEVLR